METTPKRELTLTEIQAREYELLKQFDASAAELLFLGMTAEELARRLEEAAGHRTAREERGQ